MTVLAAGRAALESLKAEAARLREDIEQLEKRGKQLEKELYDLKLRDAQAEAKNVDFCNVGSFRFFAKRFQEAMDHPALRVVADAIRRTEPEAIIFLEDAQGFCVAGSGATAQVKNIGADNLLARANEIAGGKSGGRPAMAMGRLDNPELFAKVRGQLAQFIQERSK